MRSWRRLLFAVIAVVLATFGVAGVPNSPVSAQAADTDSSIGSDGDFSGNPVGPEPSVSNLAPDAHEQAAIDNNVLEAAAAAAAPAGTDPIVPMGKPVIQTGGDDSEGLGLEPEGAAAAAGGGLVNVAGTNGTSCNHATIEDAIAAASAGGTVFIAPGVYPAQSSTFNYNIGKNLLIVQGTPTCTPASNPPSTGARLQQAAGSTVDAVVEVTGGADVRLQWLTVEGGNSAEGTVRVSGATLTLDDTIVRNGNNPSATTGGGGVQVQASATLNSINNSQIEANTADDGGGIWVENSTVDINGVDNVENNTATGNGGGIFAENSTITLQNSADLQRNDASSFGGGAYLSDSSLTATGSATDIGFSGGGNTATQGGGVYVAGASTLTVGDGSSIEGNSATFGGGTLASNGVGNAFVNINDGGRVNNNSATSGGGGIYGSTGSRISLAPGSEVTNNDSGGFGGGIVVFNRLFAGTGSDSPAPPLIAGNTAVTLGGGIQVRNGAVAGNARLDVVHVHNNSADLGGGIYVNADAAIVTDVVENGGCSDPAGVDTYCNEFRGNSATTGGGAIYAAGGDLNMVQVGFIGNSAPETAVLAAVGASSVSLRAAVVVNNTATNQIGDAVVTAADTSDLELVGVTFADNALRSAVDTDGTAVLTANRVIDTATGSSFGLAGTESGSCNLEATGNLPGTTIGDPLFVTIAGVTNYMPDSAGPAVDQCGLLGGHNSDIIDVGLRNGDGLPSGFEYDIGGLEAPLNSAGYLCDGVFATIVGTYGPDFIIAPAGVINDVIVGLDGDDILFGGDGDDRMCGNAGNDELTGQDGNDWLVGGSDNDQLAGNAGADTLKGSGGSDDVFGGSGADFIEGGGGDDTLGGSSGVDTILGEGGADVISGGSGDDGLISGGVGDDAVNGGGGNDNNVHGDGGNDTVSGNGGKDKVYGDADNDIVRGGQNDDEVYGGAGNDFVSGNDGIDLCDGGPGAGDTANAANCEIIIGIP